jgi:hypothetical protein
VNELRARSRAGKERQARISKGALQEWQEAMHGWQKNPDIPAKEDEEAEATAEAKWAGIRRG